VLLQSIRDFRDRMGLVCVAGQCEAGAAEINPPVAALRLSIGHRKVCWPGACEIGLHGFDSLAQPLRWIRRDAHVKADALTAGNQAFLVDTNSFAHTYAYWDDRSSRMAVT
jgi:hypothetical protein